MSLNIREILEQKYMEIVESEYGGDYLEALQNFESISEGRLRSILKQYYDNQRSRDQAWKNFKGKLYEFAVFKFLKQVIQKNKEWNTKLSIVLGDNLKQYRDQIAIKNWSDIYPDVDILIVDKNKNLVRAIISCKTSLRERLTETAFWKRELDRNKRTRDIKIIFITIDKDNELRIDTNRYILLHVIDCTFVTDIRRYNELINYYKKKYGNREDFKMLFSKVKPITEFPSFLKSLLTP